MRLTLQQRLAIGRTYDEAAAVAMEKTGPSVEHMSTRWIDADLQVLVIFTVSVPGAIPPFWHVSMGVKVRDVGSIAMRKVEKPLRRRLRDIGLEILNDVGHGNDSWDIGEKALHLMRDLTDDEVAVMQELQHG